MHPASLFGLGEAYYTLVVANFFHSFGRNTGVGVQPASILSMLRAGVD